MRFLLSLVAFCSLSSVSLRAGMFDIKFSGSLSGSGTFTTVGTCQICLPGDGLLSVTINIGLDSGTDAFDISDDHPGPIGPLYQPPPTNNLAYTAFNSETSDLLDMELNIWSLFRAGSTIGSGTYSVTPVPELNSLFLVMPFVALGGLRLRHQRHRA
jgi:hypothetical protein